MWCSSEALLRDRDRAPRGVRNARALDLPRSGARTLTAARHPPHPGVPSP